MIMCTGLYREFRIQNPNTAETMRELEKKLTIYIREAKRK